MAFDSIVHNSGLFELILVGMVAIATIITRHIYNKLSNMGFKRIFILAVSAGFALIYIVAFYFYKAKFADLTSQISEMSGAYYSEGSIMDLVRKDAIAKAQEHLDIDPWLEARAAIIFGLSIMIALLSLFWPIQWVMAGFAAKNSNK